MKIEEVKLLIEAFYNGETTSVEEQALLRYFEGESIPDELEEDRYVFLQLSKAKPVDIPLGLESRLNSLIDELAEAEAKEFVSMPVTRKTNHRQLWVRVGGIAASLAILFSIELIVNDKEEGDMSVQLAHNVELKDTYQDPDVAYQEAEKALLLVSANLNKGVNQISVVSKSIDKSNTILDKSVNRINIKNL